MSQSSTVYCSIYNHTTEDRYAYPELIYTSTNETHARFMFNKLIDRGLDMELKFIRLVKIETDNDGLVHSCNVLAEGWVRNLRYPSEYASTASRIRRLQ